MSLFKKSWKTLFSFGVNLFVIFSTSDSGNTFLVFLISAPFSLAVFLNPSYRVRALFSTAFFPLIAISFAKASFPPPGKALYTEEINFPVISSVYPMMF